MYIRVVRFTDVTPDRVESLVARVEESDGPPSGIPATGLQLLFDESQGTAFALQFFDSAEDGQRAFKVNGRALRVRSTFVLESPSGEELYKIQEKKLHIRDTMKVERDGETVATVQKALITPLRDRFSIELEGGDELSAKGNIVDHEY